MPADGGDRHPLMPVMSLPAEATGRCREEGCVGILPTRIAETSRSGGARRRTTLTCATGHPNPFLVTRSPSLRCLALLSLALFLSSWTGKTLGVQPCQHHDGSATHAVAAGEHAHPGTGGHGGHHAHAPSAPDAPDPGSEPPHGDCTCAGGCPSAGFAVAADPTALPSAVQTVAAAAVTPSSDALPARFAPYVLPYGTAPPRS
jgi:hypothetical protein